MERTRYNPPVVGARGSIEPYDGPCRFAECFHADNMRMWWRHELRLRSHDPLVICVKWQMSSYPSMASASHSYPLPSRPFPIRLRRHRCSPTHPRTHAGTWADARDARRSCEARSVRVKRVWQAGVNTRMWACGTYSLIAVAKPAAARSLVSAVGWEGGKGTAGEGGTRVRRASRGERAEQ